MAVFCGIDWSDDITTSRWSIQRARRWRSYE